MRLLFAAKTQELAQNHWPRRIRSSRPFIVDAIASALGHRISEPGATIDEILGPFRYENYGEHVDRILVRNLADPSLESVLTNGGRQTVLFTGGGIVRKNLLDIPGLRFLHVHPGHLPHIRGADGLLWSILIRRCPGFSCFYLTEGIDEGHVIAARDLPALKIDLSAHERPDDRFLYRTLFSFIDPLMRAQFLLDEVILKFTDFSCMPTIQQNTNEGLTYHYLHDELRSKALKLLFP